MISLQPDTAADAISHIVSQSGRTVEQIKQVAGLPENTVRRMRKRAGMLDIRDVIAVMESLGYELIIKEQGNGQGKP